MTSTRDELARTANYIVDDLGFSATLRRATGQTYDVATATNSSTPQTYPVKIALTRFSQDDVDGTNIIVGDRKIYIRSGGAVSPDEGDTIDAGVLGKIRIQRVWDVFVNSDGTAQIFVCQGRG
jgi:hypothetical protein